MQEFYARLPSHGYYAVEFTKNGCVDTTQCFHFVTGLNELDDPVQSIYPNPTSGEVNIKFRDVEESVEVRVLDLTGREVRKHFFQKIEECRLQIEDVSGIYIVEVSTESSITKFRVLKE